MFTAVVMILIITITKPVAKLKKAADEISDGNYNVNIPVKNNDEIGQLSFTFNQMAQKIDEQKKKLDHDRLNRVQEMIDWQENERQRLSRELHDGIGQLLLSVKMRVGRIKGKTPNDDGIIEDTKNIIQQTVSDIRDISNNLMPSVLTEFGLKKGIENLCNEIVINHNIETKIVSSIDELNNTRTSTYLYRIVQEATTNSIKHAKASKIMITLHQIENIIKLTIEDNGIGFDTEKNKNTKSNGLRNIRERVKLLNGNCSISSKKNTGTIINIEIPIQS
jgi:signal transduction histidine kinase